MNVRHRAGPGGATRDREVYEDLIDELGPEIEQAVDVFHIALLFESNGMNDRAAAERYGAADVVELAGKLANVVPYRPGPNRHQPTGWYGPANQPYRRCLLRGLAFVAAGLIAMTAAAAVDHPHADVVLLASSVAATTVMSPLSFLAHGIRERVVPARWAAALSPLFHAGAAAVTLVALTAVVLGEIGLAVLAAGPPAYALMAVLLVVLHRERVLALLLAPGAVAALLHLVPDPGLLTASDAASVAAVGLGVMLAVATVTLRHPGSLLDHVGRLELLAARPFLITGLASGGLVGSTIWCFSSLDPMEQADSRGWLVTALPMLAILAVSELVVVALRRRIGTMAARSSGWWAVQQLIDRATVRTWVTLSGPAAAAIVVAVWLEPVPSPSLPLLVATGFAALGATLTARAMEPDPFDWHGAVILLAMATALAGLAALSDALTPQETAALAVVVLVAGSVTVGRRSWQRSRQLSAHRWTL